jgi:integrase
MGESLGLKWSDVDLAGGNLRVNRQLQRMRREEDAGKPGRLVFSEPKNASRRTVDLPQRALTALKLHRKRQLEEKLGAAARTRTRDSSSPPPKGHRSMRRTSSTATSSLCSGAQGCPTFAGTTSGTRASLCFSAGACIPSLFSTSRGTRVSSSPSTATRTGCRRWADTPRAQWTRSSTKPAVQTGPRRVRTPCRRVGPKVRRAGIRGVRK